MSAPSGPARARASTRSRANTRGVGRSRDTRNGILTSSPGRHTASNGAAATVSERQSKLGVNGHHRNKSLRNRPRSKPADAANGGKKISSRNDAWRNSADDSASYKKHMADLYQSLKEDRDRERKDAIKNGFLADPDKPTSLAHAITPVGTCTDMCPEFERVERIVQLMVDGSEKQELAASGSKVPCEALMVKRFRRSAAGYDEQLPSDIRPPAVLKQTLDYLFNEVIRGPTQLATVHKFVWDRTRGIRNDFSIQQLTKTEDIRIAVECFERIARFHILSLHQLSRPDLKDNEFDHHQEREQLNNTLLSLMYYYDDSRHKLTSPNEAEFRAYCILFEIQNQRPDLEDRAQNWPGMILKNQRVQTALKLYAAARNPSDEQGPLRPRAAFSLAQANTGSFWAIVRSNAVSYLTACVAEIYFNIVRATALEAIWKAYKGKRGGATRIEDWVLQDMARALGLDTEEETAQYCEEHELIVAENGNGDSYVDLSSVNHSHLRDSNPRRKQMFSRSLVETKRLGRSLSAVINGLSAADATSKGLIEESDVDYASDTNDESLFLHESSEEEQSKSSSRSDSPSKGENTLNGSFPTSNEDAPGPTGVFGQPSSSLKPRPQGSETFAPNGGNSQPSSITASTSKTNPFARPKAPQIGSDGDRPAMSAGPSNPTSTLFKESSTSFNPFGTPAGQPDQSSTDAASIFTSKPPTVNPFQPPGGVPAAAQPSTSSGPPAGLVFGRPSSSFPGQGPLKSTSFSLSNHNSDVPFGGWQTQKSKTFGQPSDLKDTGDFATGQPANQSKPDSLFQGLANATSTSKSAEAELTVPSQTKAQPVSTPEVQNSKPVFTFSSPQIQAQTNLGPKKIENPSEQPGSAAPGNAQSTLTAFGPKYLCNSNAVFSRPSNGPTTEQDPKPASFPDTSKPGQSKQTSIEPSPNFASPAFNQTLFGSDPSIKDFAQNFKPPSSGPDESAKSFNNNKAHQVTSGPPSTAALPKSHNRPEILDHLAQSLMTEEGGLLAQFVEFMIRPLMRTCALKFKDEQSWAVAGEYRSLLLAKKYGKKWKANAWDLGLKRRGKERRKMLAKSMRDREQRRSSQQKVDDELSSASAADIATSILEQTSSSSRKRQSLPAQLSESREPASDAPAINGAKRKRDESDHVTNQSTPPAFKASHTRSNTLGASVMSAPPNRRSRKTMPSSVDPNRIGDGSVLGDLLMQQARRLAPHVKSDTTHTSYFKLKAMGLDPDTPLVPATSKRPAPSTRISSLSEASNKANDPSSDPLTKKPRLQPQQDDDEELFASIRAVRETLADSTAWFQSERATMEKSLTPRTSTAPQDRSSTAQGEAQGFTAKTRTPTRTELRNKALGDKSLFPSGFWDSPKAASGQSIKDDNVSRSGIRDTETPSKPRGLAALAKHGNLKGGSDRAALGQDSNQGSKKAAGVSAEDAIEL